ncbi:MAG: hypothetical protein J3K34DRAFT_445799 [Monoraphidium minutum]|nr:MAG: hypothetical protein J3K34DRAFT_445799 [Monoraphidium minutum]
MDYEHLASQLHDVQTPADPRVVAALPRSSYMAGGGEADACAVCQCEYQEGDRMVHFPCLHKYHEDCVLPWLEAHKTCPLCKEELR